MGLRDRFRKKPKADRVEDAAMPPPTTEEFRFQPEPVRAGDLTVGDYANGIPNIRLGEMFRSFFRQMVWVVPLLLMGWVAAWIMTADFKRTYTGEGTIMVQLGDEYVYQSVFGDAGGASLLQTPDTIALNEIAIIKNAEVMDRVIGEIKSAPGGLQAFAPEIADKMNRSREGSLDYQMAYMELRNMMDRNFMIAARPKSSIIDMAYRHENPQLSVTTLNRLMDAYLSYRRTVFVEGAGDAIAQRRADTEEQLAQNERRIAAFLKRNTISDFESEQTGARKRTEDLKATLNTLRADMAETERSLAVVEDQLRRTPETINLYVDDRASNRIAQAELELKQLLAKYLPTSDPVRQKQREIEELRALQRSNNGQASGGRRVGPNPVFQELLTRRNTLAATANSQREKEVTVQRQLNSVDGKLRRMTELSPEYMDLLRTRETLNTRLKSYLAKEQEALINQQQSANSTENIRLISRATYPVKGRNMRMYAFAFAALGWGFTLFMLALFRVFADPRLYATPNRIEAAVRPVADETPEPSQIPEPVQPRPFGAPGVMPDEFQPAAYQTEMPAYDPVPESQPLYQEWSVDGTTGVPASPAHESAPQQPSGYPVEYDPQQHRQQMQAAAQNPYAMENPYLSRLTGQPDPSPYQG